MRVVDDHGRNVTAPRAPSAAADAEDRPPIEQPREHVDEDCAPTGVRERVVAVDRLNIEVARLIRDLVGEVVVGHQVSDRSSALVKAAAQPPRARRPSCRRPYLA
jgi:hypothetical protein